MDDMTADWFSGFVVGVAFAIPVYLILDRSLVAMVDMFLAVVGHGRTGR